MSALGYTIDEFKALMAERDALQLEVQTLRKKLEEIHYATLDARKGTLAAKISDFIVFGYRLRPATPTQETPHEQ